MAGDRFNSGAAFMRGLVGQHWVSGDVADGVDVVIVGLQLSVDRHKSAVGNFNFGVFKAEAFRVRFAADGDKDLPVLFGEFFSFRIFKINFEAV